MSALRLSKANLILFCEGTDFDPLFYGNVAKRYQEESGSIVELRRATELPNNALPGLGGSGGQLQLLQAAALWESYRRKHLHRWKHPKVIVFGIDKDVADITGLPEFNPNVIRTIEHSVENYLFASVDIVSATEAALSLAPNEMRAFAQSSSDWQRSVAPLWKEWIAFCLLAIRLRAQNVPNYSSNSLFNDPIHGQCDSSKSALHFDRLQQISGLSISQFHAFKLDTEKLVSEIYARGEHNRLFKGKWYAEILLSALRSSAWAHQVNSVGKVGLMAAIRARYSLKDDHYAYYKDFFRGLGLP